ncbi:hypothetical protein AB9_164 [Acinetobacter phage vB_AbaM_B9]|nr:hypothetical protein AB9_008 [Acinetobacter phage vB_AbaM_B9]AWD93312.1 hypothetical protein AB9_164 [Acinetobacter phage vB_AbaM_B9]
MLYQIQVKADNQRVYRKLSIKMRSIEALKKDLEAYVIMYGEGNQINHHTVSAQIIDQNGNVVFERLSNATINRV